MADDLGHLTEQIKSVANDNKRVSEESVTSFRQAANDNTQSMANFAKDLNSYFSKQKNDLQNLTDAIETSVTETQNVARKIDNTNQLLQNSINIQREMLSELTSVSGTLNDLLTEEKGKKEGGGALGGAGVISEIKSIFGLLTSPTALAIGAVAAALGSLFYIVHKEAAWEKEHPEDLKRMQARTTGSGLGTAITDQGGVNESERAASSKDSKNAAGVEKNLVKESADYFLQHPEAKTQYLQYRKDFKPSTPGEKPLETPQWYEKNILQNTQRTQGGNITGGNQQAQNQNGSASQAMQFFQSKGWTKEQAAGIVGNLQVESGNFASDVISGKRRGDGGAAVGIGQWHSDRQKKFESIFGHSLIGAPFTEQLEFVHWELMHGYGGNWLKNAKSASEAADIFNKKFEISKNRNNPSAADNKQRISNANTLAGSANQTNNQIQTSQQSAAPFSVTPKTTGSTATGGYKATNQTHPELYNGQNPQQGATQISNSQITNNKNEGDYEEAVVDQNGGMTTLKTRSGKKYQVASAYAKKFFGFVDSLEKTGYKINSISGYANRNIAGTNTKSWHAKGMAIDINPDQNPVSFKPSKSKTDMPPGTDALAAKFGLGWGHMWTGKKQDSMHFSAGPNEGGEVGGYRKSQEGNQQTEQGSTSSSNSNEDSQRVASSEMQEAPGAVGSGGVQGAPAGIPINPMAMFGGGVGGAIGGIASLIHGALSAPAPGPIPQPKMAAAQPPTPTQMAAAPLVSPHSQAAVNRENIPEHTKNSSPPDWSEGLLASLAPKFATLYAHMT